MFRKFFKKPTRSKRAERPLSSANSSGVQGEGHPVDDAALMTVSEMIGKDWKQLCYKLCLTQGMIDCIELDQDKYGAKMMAIKSLEAWKNREGDNATMEKLKDSLIAIKRMDIASEIALDSFRSKTTGSSFFGFAGDDISLTLEQLKAKLRKKYKTLRMKGLPWMEDLCLSMDNHYVSLEMVKKRSGRPNANEAETNSENGISKQVKLEEIFPSLIHRTRSFGKQKSFNILVEGHPGFGKTTLASKLCYDYGNGKNYMQQFDVVLFFPLRNFAGSVDEMICNAAFVTKKQLSCLSEIINSESVQTLIILDGHDELAEKHVNSILTLIRGEILPHVSLVVTSRLGRFTEKNSDPTTDVEIDMEPAWDCQYKLIGLNEKKQAEFVERHLKNFSPDKKRCIEREMKQMKEKKFITAEYLKCPLFFLMVFLLLSEDLQHNLQHVRTMTELYKKVFNFVIRRFLTKHSVPIASKADLFSFNNANRPYVNLIAKLGEISLSALKAEQLSFSKEMISELSPDILKIGFLTQTSFIDGLKEVVYYEAIHKSLIEFAAAYSLLINFPDGPRDQWNKTIVDLRPTWASSNSLVLPFLAGLMGNEAGSLFDAIQPHVEQYSDEDSFEKLFPILREAQMSDIRSLIPFLPSKWKTHWNMSNISSSSFPPEIMLQGLKAGKIKEILWYLEHPFCFTEDIKVAGLNLMLFGKMCPLDENQFKRIECQSLSYSIVYTPRGQEIKALLSLVSSIHFKHLSFLLSCHHISQFLSLLSESLIKGHLNETNIQMIKCDMWYEEDANETLDLLSDLIKRERIESLDMQFIFVPTQQHLQPLFESIAKSSRLTEFVLRCGIETCPLAEKLAKLHIEKKIYSIYNWEE